MRLIDRLHGVMPALVTLLTPQGSLDEPAMARLVERAVQGGVDGLTVLGTTGEGPALPAAVREQAIRVTVKTAAGQVPVIVGVGENHTAEALREIERAAELGADGALVLPPFYYTLSQDAIAGFFTALARSTDLPLLIYNIPGYTKNGVTPETLRVLAREPGIVGMKDSGGEFTHFQAFLTAQSDTFRLFQGKGPHVFAAYLLGAAGSITPCPNLHLEWEIAIRAAAARRDVTTGNALQQKLAAFAALIAYRGYPLHVNLKALLELAGLGGRTCVHPAPELAEADIAELNRRHRAIAE